MSEAALRSGPAHRFRLGLALAGLAAFPAHAASGREGQDRRPYAEAEMQPGTQASCEQVRASTEDLERELGPDPGLRRMDLSVKGALRLVHFDGTLAYLGLCGDSPAPKVLCVTYQTNGMKVGDTVIVTGAYSRPSDDFILLDPCLASQPD